MFGRWKFDDVFSLFPNLGERRGQPAGGVAGGEQQMLTMCRTLIGDPDLVIIDEPTEGVAPRLVDQKPTIALKISHRLYAMGHGRIVFAGYPPVARKGQANSVQKGYSVLSVRTASLGTKEPIRHELALPGSVTGARAGAATPHGGKPGQAMPQTVDAIIASGPPPAGP